MIGITREIPSEEELRNRIQHHLSWRDTETTALIWHGYIIGLLEWGLISVDCHARLVALLPGVGKKELVEMMLGDPLSAEQEAEIDQAK